MTNITKANFRVDLASKQKFHKSELLRIVKTKDNEIFLDLTQNAHGRAVYLKPTYANYEFILKKNLLSKGLKTKVSQAVYLTILQEIEANWNG